ncbi:MAG: short-chain dehydrogenase/reductase [Alphaproteobacteria bacterium]|nr:short-chain dehydrogenase/reductase [Alphaproteobacteria bacterium]
MDLRLAGQTAVITGGSAGIGLATAEMLAREGARVILIARDPDKLAGATERIRALGGEVVVEAADVSDDDTHPRLAERYGDADILINNAGAIPGGGLDRLDQASFRASWDLKVFGFIGMTRAFYALMRARGRGVILNVIGASGTRGDAAYIAGSVGNAALTSLTKALGAEAPAYGVRVLGLSPGPVMTSRMEGVLRQQATEKLGDAERWAEFAAAFPFGRMADPEEVAAVGAFLVSPRASYMSGVVVNVDAGMSERHEWWPAPPR